MKSEESNINKVFVSSQAARKASLTVLRPTVHDSETSRTQKRSLLCGLAASIGVLNPKENKHNAENDNIATITYICLLIGGLLRIVHIIIFPVQVRDAYNYYELIINWSKNGVYPDYTTVPPLVLYLLKIPFSVFNYDIIKGAVVVNVIEGLLIILFIILISKSFLKSEWKICCIGMIAATHPTLIYYSCEMLRDNSYVLGMCICVFVFLKYYRTPKIVYVILLGLLAALVQLCRLESIALIPVLYGGIMITRLNLIVKIKQLFILSTMFFITLIGVLYYLDASSYLMEHNKFFYYLTLEE